MKAKITRKMINLLKDEREIFNSTLLHIKENTQVFMYIQRIYAIKDLKGYIMFFVTFLINNSIFVNNVYFTSSCFGH